MRYIKLFNEAFTANNNFFNDKLNWKLIRFIQDTTLIYEDKGVKFSCVALITNDTDRTGHEYDLLYDITADEYTRYASEIAEKFEKSYDKYLNETPYKKIRYDVWIYNFSTEDNPMSTQEIKKILADIKDRIYKVFDVEVGDYANGFGVFLKSNA